MELLTVAFSVLKVDNNDNSAKSKSTIFFCSKSSTETLEQCVTRTTSLTSF